MRSVSCNGWTVYLPMPVYPIIEDVGWWRGEDGSAHGEPFRNGFPRSHLLADYKALARMAKTLGIKLLLGMVLGEWDRWNLLKTVPGATWLGANWNNSMNIGPESERVAQYLGDNLDLFEFGVHGLCHEFWQNGRMERTEFYDPSGAMRPRAIVEHHLHTYMKILHDYLPSCKPRVYIPPALQHSFGNGNASMQAVLESFGIRYVLTSFAKARQYQPPRYPCLTWEQGVCLLERGESPVHWQEHACAASWDFSGPVLPLHWGNILHPDPEKSVGVVDGWCEMIRKGCAQPQRILVDCIDGCWRQMVVWTFAELRCKPGEIVLDLGGIPRDVPLSPGEVALKIVGRAASGGRPSCRFRLSGGDSKEVALTAVADSIYSLNILPESATTEITLDIVER